MSTETPTRSAVPAAAGEPGEGSPPGTGHRPRAVRRRRRLPVRWIALGAVGVVGIGWLGWASPVTLVEHVVVEAPRGLSAESIRLASGISAADHVLAVDADRVRAAIMQAIPAVADVDVQRSLPDTIRLEVTPRTPLAAVQTGDAFLVMDADGVVYDRVASARRLPVIRSGTEAGRAAARAVLLSLPEDLRADVRRVTATTRDDVALALDGGAKVRWGSPEQADLKARVLAGLLAVGADVYDVRSPLQPTTTGGTTPEEAAAP
ncbi:MAG: FtsQ-type POTRA domain-containing protein [Candidatus Nanopelagicales bacterium]|nr:FtsQ-type POTRA domain-containing protein [Candidatus Nanopelagicales bacterium]